jgi:polar amino acid transport system substrate-binding protein
MPAIVSILFRSALLIILTASFVSSQEWHPDIQRIKERGKLIIALTNKDQPPFYMVNKEGELQGLDVMLGKDIAEELGVDVQFDRTAKTFEGLIDLIVRKKADVAISKLSKTLKRAEKVLFTRPYIVLRKGLLVNRLKMAQAKGDEDPIEFIIHMRGDIGVVGSTSYVGFARKMFPEATIKEFNTWEEVIAALDRGDILAAFRDELEIKKIIRKYPDITIDVKTVVFKDTKDPIAMAVSFDNTHLLYWLNEYLETKNYNLDADKLLSKYPEIFSSKDK